MNKTQQEGARRPGTDRETIAGFGMREGTVSGVPKASMIPMESAA
jgi:hypothetical protein